MVLTTTIFTAITATVIVIDRCGRISRRARVGLLLSAFFALQLLPFALQVADHFCDVRIPTFNVMPFRAYSLYSTPAPESFTEAEAVLVDDVGAEHPIDFRVWEPLIPRYANRLLLHSLSQSPESQQHVAATLFEKSVVALQTRESAGQFDGFNEYLLGQFSYPKHQTPASLWGRSVEIPLSDAVVGVRVYRVGWNKQQRRLDPSQYSRVLAYEYVR